MLGLMVGGGCRGGGLGSGPAVPPGLLCGIMDDYASLEVKAALAGAAHGAGAVRASQQQRGQKSGRLSPIVSANYRTELCKVCVACLHRFTAFTGVARAPHGLHGPLSPPPSSPVVSTCQASHPPFPPSPHPPPPPPPPQNIPNCKVRAYARWRDLGPLTAARRGARRGVTSWDHHPLEPPSGPFSASQGCHTPRTHAPRPKRGAAARTSAH
jgi:hypothetical protein